MCYFLALANNNKQPNRKALILEPDDASALDSLGLVLSHKAKALRKLGNVEVKKILTKSITRTISTYYVKFNEN